MCARINDYYDYMTNSMQVHVTEGMTSMQVCEQSPASTPLAKALTECMLSTQGWMALAVTCYTRNPQSLSFLSVLMHPKYMDANLPPYDELSGGSKLVAARNRSTCFKCAGHFA